LNKIILFFIFILFSKNLFSKECKNQENLIDYFYLNGVGVDDSMVDNSVTSLVEKTKIETIKSLYNPTESYPFIDFINKNLLKVVTTKDLAETLRQKLLETDNSYNLESEAYQELYQLGKNMLSELTKDKKNVIIAHSQGNLFANSICDFNDNKKDIEVIGIATPASAIKCGRNYITFKEDSVINGLRSLAEATSKIKPPLPANASVSEEVKTKTNHGLIESYLADKGSLSRIKSFIKEAQDPVVDSLKFEVLQIESVEDKAFFSFQEDSINKVKEVKNKVEMFFRKQISKFNVYSYFSRVFFGKIALNALTFFIVPISDEEMKRIANVEINVNSNEEYGDSIAYASEIFKSFCSFDSFKKHLSKECAHVENLNHFESKRIPSSVEIFKRLDINLNSDPEMTKFSSNKLSISCLDIQNEKRFEISATYSPVKNLVAKFLVNDNEYEVLPKNQINDERETEVIGNVIVEEKDSILIPKFVPKISKLNEYDLSEFESLHKKCNSLSKLKDKVCEKFFFKILKEEL